MTGQPDVAGAVLALDRAMIALAVAKSTLLGERRIRPCPECARDIADEAHQIGCPLDLAAAEASPANPYGSAKHGVYTAPSAAAVAQDVEPELALCLAPDAHGPLAAYRGAYCEVACHHAGPTPTGHLPQHTHGEPGCTYTGCTVHDAAVTR